VIRRHDVAVGLVAVLALLGLSVVAAAGATSVSWTNQRWSGFMVENTKSGNISSVAGTWTVPTVSCAAGANSASAEWVGLGGHYVSWVQTLLGDLDKNTQFETLYQTGVDASCADGTPTYRAWEQFYGPQHADVQTDLTSKDQVRPGDIMSAGVANDDSTAATTWYIYDVRAHKMIWLAHGAWKNHLAGFHTAECVVEDPLVRGGGSAPLSDFGTVTFSTCDASRGPTANTSLASLSLPRGWRLVELNIKQGSSILATATENPLTVTYAGAASSQSNPSSRKTASTGLPTPSPGATIEGTSTGGDKFTATLAFGNPETLDAAGSALSDLGCLNTVPINAATTVVVPAVEVTTASSSLQQRLIFSLQPVAGGGTGAHVVADVSEGPSCIDQAIGQAASQVLNQGQSVRLNLWFVYPDVLSPDAPTASSNATILGETPFQFVVSGSAGYSTMAEGSRVADCGGTTAVVPYGTITSTPSSGIVGCTPVAGSASSP
jgi:hypothetical protein